MKNKKLIYFLLPLVIAIWGIIFYKIFYYANPDNEEAISSTKKKSVLTTRQEMKDTFSIVADYRDPFHGNMISRDEKPKQMQPSKPVQLKIPLTPIDWSFISYSGVVKNKKTNNQLALVKMNGKEHLVRAKDTISGVVIQKIYKDSIEVMFQKEKKVIKK